MKMKVLTSWGLMLLASFILVVSACQKKDDTADPDPGTCNGPGQVTVSGAVSGNYCLAEVTQYKYTDYVEISVVTNNGEESVMLFIRVGESGSGSTPVVGTFQVGDNNPGFVQVGFHGSNEEFFNSVSGTVTITQMSASSFKATFTVTAKGYYNDQTVSASGSVTY